MNVGFTGTHHGMTEAQLTTVTRLLATFSPRISGMGHGDCIGADAQFHQVASKLGLLHLMTIHPPIDPKRRAFCVGAMQVLPALPYLVRDKKIVQDCSVLLATPHTAWEQLRSGTWATVRYARKSGKEVRLIWPDGSVSLEEGIVRE